MRLNHFVDFALVAGSVGLAAKFGILLLGFLLLLRCAPGRPRTLLQWGLVVLLANVMLPMFLVAVVGVVRLITGFSGDMWADTAIKLLQDLLFAIGLALLLQALWLTLPRKQSAPG
ncbi:hypothetical protein JR064_07785 [Xanthomonas sp. CFBP 8703]|uniref:Uncharacterized protein n=1 Tax=Xanthomonas bonasiae TaxID=2810351 RepID=A0ABS3B0C9_9XANT|nr:MULTISPECIES: hypothetical protein [Xanthomonas]MBD7923211.1 hypothetical protein [Xanthomonas surreyensis]MBN6102065.1 hypothetical protein [Xanthomonas bonasiae]